MLEFIRKYRKDPNRTVVTFKMNEIVCLNKLSELNIGSAAVPCGCSGAEQKQTPKKVDNVRKDYSKEKDEDDKRGTSSALEAMCECAGVGSNCSCASVPGAEARLKGGLSCEKTIRILLCDLVFGMALGMMGALGTVVVKKMLK